jgi:hypothetical protein
MTKQEILKDTQFEEVAEAKLDAKHRIALGRTLGGRISSYRIYRNRVGQIILDPMVTIPAYEAWLFKNRRAFKMVTDGLKDAQEGRMVKATPEDLGEDDEAE